MNKKVKVILNLLIAASGIACLCCFVLLVSSIRYANREVEDPSEKAMSTLEYKLKHQAYGEVLSHYYTKRMDNFEAPAGMEDFYHVAEYAHLSFMSRVYEEKQDEGMIRANDEKRKNVKEQLGSYAYTADEVDEIIRNAP